MLDTTLVEATIYDNITEENGRGEVLDTLRALRARVTELTEKLTEALLNPTLLAEAASAWSIRNRGYPMTESMNEKADYYESIISVLRS